MTSADKSADKRAVKAQKRAEALRANLQKRKSAKTAKTKDAKTKDAKPAKKGN